MSNIWLNIIKPKGIYAKWLTFLTLVAIVALGASGQFEIVKQHLDTPELTVTIGDFSISAYGFIRALVVMILIFWVTAIAAELVEKSINKITKLRAANSALLIKILQIAIYFIAFLFTLDIAGVDLTTLTVFSGALGIGLGFGLQKISSNFISGIILLLEKSIEKDDLVEMSDGTLGFVRKASSRYTLIETFDGKEIMVPNEDFITNRVTNWTYTSTQGRVEVAIGVSYQSDIEKAYELILEAAHEHPRSIADPKPKCFLRQFADSSVNFTLQFWVEDITFGRWEPQSEVQFAIWKKFKEHKIEIPFPQRDIHLKSPDSLKVISHANN